MRLAKKMLLKSKIKISDDFSYAPGPRYKFEGDNSGELFREKILLPAVKNALENNEKLTIDLDDTGGYGTSFLEESFGGLIRVEKLDYEKLKNLFIFISEDEPFLIEDIKEYLENANEENKS